VPEFTPELRSFVSRCLESVEDVEVLIFLLQQRGRAWSADAIGKALGLDTETAGRRLEVLSTRNLLSVRVANDLLYQFNPGTEELEAATIALADLYRERRLAVLGLIAQRRSAAIRDFADAFRLRRREDDE
jgi:predicted ArsR family transcriptional regulator